MNLSANSPPSAAQSTRLVAWGAACGATAFAAAYFDLLPARSLTFDEAYSAHVVGYPLFDLIRFVAARDAHPPLFYLLLKAWTATFGDSPTALLAFSAVGGAKCLQSYTQGVEFVPEASRIALCRVLAAVDRATLIEMGERNARAYAQHFSIPRFVERHVALADMMTGGSPPSSVASASEESAQ